MFAHFILFLRVCLLLCRDAAWRVYVRVYICTAGRVCRSRVCVLFCIARGPGGKSAPGNREVFCGRYFLSLSRQRENGNVNNVWCVLREITLPRVFEIPGS